MALGASRPVLLQVGLMTSLVGSVESAVTLNVGLIGGGGPKPKLFGQLALQCHVERG